MKSEKTIVILKVVINEKNSSQHEFDNTGEKFCGVLKLNMQM